jgi:hypothetical protein
MSKELSLAVIFRLLFFFPFPAIILSTTIVIFLPILAARFILIYMMTPHVNLTEEQRVELFGQDAEIFPTPQVIVEEDFRVLVNKRLDSRAVSMLD